MRIESRAECALLKLEVKNPSQLRGSVAPSILSPFPSLQYLLADMRTRFAPCSSTIKFSSHTIVVRPIYVKLSPQKIRRRSGLFVIVEILSSPVDKYRALMGKRTVTAAFPKLPKGIRGQAVVEAVVGFRLHLNQGSHVRAQLGCENASLLVASMAVSWRGRTGVMHHRISSCFPYVPFVQMRVPREAWLSLRSGARGSRSDEVGDVGDGGEVHPERKFRSAAATLILVGTA